jgi:hypothetical protein
MELMRRVLILALGATISSGCTFEQMSRNVYEGSRVYDESLRSTPLERPKSDLPSYDQYDEERRRGATKQTE